MSELILIFNNNIEPSVLSFCIFVINALCEHYLFAFDAVSDSIFDCDP